MLEGPLPQKVDHRKLASERARLTGEIAIGQLSRFSEYLASGRGEVGIELQFRRGKGQRTLITGKVTTEVVLTCQYCLEQMTMPVTADINVLVVDSTETLLALPQGQDGVVCETEMLTLTDVLEDELIVSLPMAPKHARGECVDISSYADDEPVTDTHRPFADLKKQLK